MSFSLFKSPQTFVPQYPEPKQLQALLGESGLASYHHLESAITVSGIAHDSRRLKKGDAFFCLAGERHDGNRFVDDAIAQGASCIFSEESRSDCPCPYIVVPNVRLALAKVASALFEHPSRKLRLIGVTGTNGKTTTTHIIERALLSQGRATGLIGTLGARWSKPNNARSSQYLSIIQTTPEISDIQNLLYQMVKEGMTHVAMEWSSHALALERAASCDFAVALMTNVTQDHLDFHKTMEHYWRSKLRLFEQLEASIKENKTAVINNDDPLAHEFLATVGKSTSVLTYGWDHDADIRVLEAYFDFLGTKLVLKTPCGELKLKLKLNGRFNVYNAMAALAACIAEGIDIQALKQVLMDFAGVEGRFEIVPPEQDAGPQPLCIVDYAHTPDGLSNVLEAARALVPNEGKLLVVFGCGGDRDSSKRPQMGEIAEQLSDTIIVTSDNPRSEDPQAIVYEILAGIKRMKSVNVELDRLKAINLALETASDNDVVVIAGKGHETYQILKDKTIEFDDRQVARAALQKRASRLRQR